MLHEFTRAGWILTGGRSTRMGTDKALVDVNGRPLVLAIADKIAAVCGIVTLVGEPAKYIQLGLPVIPDHFSGAGPLSGIEAALAATAADLNLIVACDMPALNQAILERLFDPAFDCSLPRYPDGKVEPLCAVYHQRCHPAIRAALEQGTRKVTDALASFAIRYVSVVHREPFTNLNTPEDLEKYRHG